MELPRGITSKDDVLSFGSRYRKGEPGNSHDTTKLTKKCNDRVSGDFVAEEAMSLFLNCKLWHLVDFCEDNLPKMRDKDAQLFREVLILSAPHMALGNYTDRVVKLIGDPTLITEAYFQNRTFLYDMFFYAAVETAKRGYSWYMTEIGVSICSELRILAEVFHWEECKEVNSLIVRDVAYGGDSIENVLRATATKVWPKLPDAFTEREWLSNQASGS
jgi:hypothetical protein